MAHQSREQGADASRREAAEAQQAEGSSAESCDRAALHAALDQSPHAPLGDVLKQVSHELGQLSGRLGHIEQLVGPPILEAARRDPRFLHQIQDLDHIRQKILALADFLACLAHFAPEQYRVDAAAAARSLTLTELAARLTLSDEGAGSGDTELGDFELF